jgi:hypothetical protein
MVVRGISLILAVGLVILWLVGLSQHATAWLTWLNGLGALVGFAIAAGAVPRLERGVGSGGSIALAIGLGVLWIIGLAEHRETWLVWWTFAFACAYFLLGIGSGASTTRRPIVTTTTHPRPA